MSVIRSNLDPEYLSHTLISWLASAAPMLLHNHWLSADQQRPVIFRQAQGGHYIQTLLTVTLLLQSYHCCLLRQLPPPPPPPPPTSSNLLLMCCIRFNVCLLREDIPPSRAASKRLFLLWQNFLAVCYKWSPPWLKGLWQMCDRVSAGVSRRWTSASPTPVWMEATAATSSTSSSACATWASPETCARRT